MNDLLGASDSPLENPDDVSDAEATSLIQDICHAQEPEQRLAALCRLFGTPPDAGVPQIVRQLQQHGLCYVETQSEAVFAVHPVDSDWLIVDLPP